MVIQVSAPSRHSSSDIHAGCWSAMEYQGQGGYHHHHHHLQYCEHHHHLYNYGCCDGAMEYQGHHQYWSATEYHMDIIFHNQLCHELHHTVREGWLYEIG